MRKLILMMALALPFAAGAGAFVPLRKGAVLEYRYRDPKGKILRDEWRKERFLRLTVEDVWGDSVVNVAIWNETFERLVGNEPMRGVIEGLSYGDVRVTDKDIVFENLMWTFLPEMLYRTGGEKRAANGKSFEWAVDATAVLPRGMAVGDTLPPTNYKAVFSEKLDADALAEREESMRELEQFQAEFAPNWVLDMPKFPTAFTYEQTVAVRNRLVEGVEKIDGRECWKISYEMTEPFERVPGVPKRITINDGEMTVDYGDGFVPPVAKYVDYWSEDVGLVRREKLNARGKIVETMTLESVR